MEVAALFLHNMRTQPCPGWIFDGDGWDDHWKQLVDEIFDMFLERKQCPDFNFWRVVRIGNSTLAKRFTWRDCWIGGSLQKLREDLEKQYPDWREGKSSTLKPLE